MKINNFDKFLESTSNDYNMENLANNILDLLNYTNKELDILRIDVYKIIKIGYISYYDDEENEILIALEKAKNMIREYHFNPEKLISYIDILNVCDKGSKTLNISIKDFLEMFRIGYGLVIDEYDREIVLALRDAKKSLSNFKSHGGSFGLGPMYKDK